VPEQQSWRAPRKKERALELDKLISALDASQSDGPRVIVFEMDRRTLGEVTRLLGELHQRWRARDKRILIVDAHADDPFIKFDQSPAEGFSEMLHYGLSPENLRVKFPGLDADFIAAGGMGKLAPADPAEPARSIRRLAAAADRVILLVDSRDGEGLLSTLLEESAFRLRLSDPELDEHLERLASRRSAGRMRMLFILGIPLLVWLVYMLLPDEDPKAELALDVPPPPSHRVHALPENADLPYFGGGNGGEVAQDTSSEVDFTLAVIGEGDDSTVAEPSEPDSTPLQQENTPEESHTQIPEEAQDLRGTKVVKAAPRAAQRRAESRVNWNSALDHKGSFHVHVSSFRDSARALLAQEREGFSELPVRLHPVDVEGRTWYRVLVGEFPDLLSAAAFRDSLLDQAGRDFCVIGIDPEP
jgi:hypothetical protein